MIVLDASAVLELLLGTEAGQDVAERIADPGLGLHTPDLLDVEIAQALRRYVRSREVDEPAAHAMLSDLRALDLERHAHEPLLDRVWSLRDDLTAYDAVYVALAEALETKLLTCDRRLGGAPGLEGRIDVVGAR